MRYVSTRGEARAAAFEEVLLTGLAGDGGLYLPESWPRLDAAALRAMRGLPYPELAARVMWPFVEGAVAETEFHELARDAYAGFDHPAVAPLRQLGAHLWLLELFHGPTLAFKDYALQLLGRLFDHFLARRGERVTVVGATSGDTGSAAIEACRDRDAIDVFILHPRGRISDVQRRQMTTVEAPNVHNIALEGTFDDCQDVVKGLFNDSAFRDEVRLSAVNSINWARIMAQIPYYVAAAVALGAPDRAVRFAVPTGNFGNIYAAYGARAMGLPVDRLIAGSNSNDILARFFEGGVMALGPVESTLSPSMDIQISSNFERVLLDLYDRDGAAVAAAMAAFRGSGRLDVGRARWRRACEVFVGCRVDDETTLAMIERVYETCGMLVDPHTAVGLVAAEDRDEDVTTPLVALACAHPAKFPQAVERATGVRPALPRRLADLMEREERLSVLGNDLAAVRTFISERIGAGQAA